MMPRTSSGGKTHRFPTVPSRNPRGLWKALENFFEWLSISPRTVRPMDEKVEGRPSTTQEIECNGQVHADHAGNRRIVRQVREHRLQRNPRSDGQVQRRTDPRWSAAGC